MLLERNSRKEDEQKLFLGCMGLVVDNQATSISPNVGEPLGSSRGFTLFRIPRPSLRETFLEASIEVENIKRLFAYLFSTIYPIYYYRTSIFDIIG